MNALRKEVAWLMGWHKHDCGDGLCWKNSHTEKTGAWYDVVPEYDTSLDACAEFEATLTEKVEQADYASQLIQQINHERHGEFRFMGASQFDQMTATPAQRCRAFLAVKGIPIPDDPKEEKP